MLPEQNKGSSVRENSERGQIEKITDRQSAAVSQLTGIDVQLLDEAEATAIVLLPHGETVEFGFSRPMAPVLGVADEAATVMGRYACSGKPAMAYKQTGQAFHFFCGVGNLPGSLLRHIAAMARVHIYADTNDPVYVNNRLFGIHAQSGEACSVLLPDPAVRHVYPLFDPPTAVVRVVDRRFEANIPRGETQLYLLGGMD